MQNPGMQNESAGRSPTTGNLTVLLVSTLLWSAFGDGFCCACRFVSEFLAKVPAETRVALAAVARLESYKKDQAGAAC